MPLKDKGKSNQKSTIMKRMLTTLAILFLALPISAQMNPNQEYYRTMRWKAKDGKTANFIENAGKKTKMYNNTPENAMVTYRITTGPDQGKFERVLVGKSLDYLYNHNSQQELDYWSKNVAQYADSPEGAKIWWRIKGWSVNWEDSGAPSKYMNVHILTLRSDNGGDFRRYMNRYMEILKENSTVKRAVFKISSGSHPLEFRIITFFDDPMKARGEWKSEDFNMEDAYNSKYGFNAFRTDSDLYYASIEIYGQMIETHTLVPEMSFMGN